MAKDGNSPKFSFDWFCTGMPGEILWNKLLLKTVLANNIISFFNFASMAD